MTKRVKKLEEFLSALRDLTGDALYAESVRRLWGLLSPDYVFAGDFVAEEEAVDVRAFCAGGEMRPAYRYDLAGTPCVNTLAGSDNACLYLGDVVERFPHHHRLRELGVTSYIGVPILDGDAEPAGLIVLLYKGLPTNTSMIPVVLELMSTRLSHDVQRREAELHGVDIETQSDRQELAQRLHQSMCVLRLQFSVASQLMVSDIIRHELDHTADSIKLVIEKSLEE